MARVQAWQQRQPAGRYRSAASPACGSEELLSLLVADADELRRPALGQSPVWFLPSTANNAYVREAHSQLMYHIEFARNGGRTQALARILSAVPFGAQTMSDSVYFDRSLFAYDDRVVSPADLPRVCTTTAVKARSARRGATWCDAGTKALPDVTRRLRCAVLLPPHGEPAVPPADRLHPGPRAHAAEEVHDVCVPPVSAARLFHPASARLLPHQPASAGEEHGPSVTRNGSRKVCAVSSTFTEQTTHHKQPRTRVTQGLC